MGYRKQIGKSVDIQAAKLYDKCMSINTETSHDVLDSSTYDKYIVQANEFVQEGVELGKLDNFLDRSMDIYNKVQEGASKSAIWLRVSEVYGFVAGQAIFEGRGSETYRDIKEHIQGYSDEQKAFLLKSLYYSQENPAKAQWEKEAHGDTGGSGTDVTEAWLISVIA
jgi:hypothetical protein